MRRIVVKNGFNGLLCEVKSSQSLMQAMQSIMDMSDGERSVMGENGRSLVVEKYGEHLVVEATMRAVESAVNG